MSNQLADEVRVALTEAAHDVEIPPIDVAGFESVLRGTRRSGRSRAFWIAAGGSGVAAAILGLLVVTDSLSGQDGAPPATGPNHVVPGAAEAAVLVGDDGAVTFVGGVTDGLTVRTSVGAIKDAYRTADGAVLLDGSGTLSRLRIHPAKGTPSVDAIADDVDSVQVSTDGNVVAWIEAGPEGPMFRQLWLDSGLLSSVEAPAAGSIVAVQGVRALVSVGPDLWIWRTTGAGLGDPKVIQSRAPISGADGLHADEFSVDGAWSGNIVSLPRADRTDTDLLRVEGTSLEHLGQVPLAEGVVSSSGDRIVGFTQDAVAADGGGTADAVEVWTLHGVLATGFSELPSRVDRVVWLDNDTLGVTGGEAGERGSVDYYVCDVVTRSCSEQLPDPTGPGDEFPMLASGRDLAS